jgi:hypothetical protein
VRLGPVHAAGRPLTKSGCRGNFSFSQVFFTRGRARFSQRFLYWVRCVAGGPANEIGVPKIFFFPSPGFSQTKTKIRLNKIQNKISRLTYFFIVLGAPALAARAGRRSLSGFGSWPRRRSLRYQPQTAAIGMGL